MLGIKPAIRFSYRDTAGMSFADARRVVIQSACPLQLIAAFLKTGTVPADERPSNTGPG